MIHAWETYLHLFVDGNTKSSKWNNRKHGMGELLSTTNTGAATITLVIHDAGDKA